jgi:hypothetical protein
VEAVTGFSDAGETKGPRDAYSLHSKQLGDLQCHWVVRYVIVDTGSWVVLFTAEQDSAGLGLGLRAQTLPILFSTRHSWLAGWTWLKAFPATRRHTRHRPGSGLSVDPA